MRKYKQARGKPDQTRSIPQKGYIYRALLHETGTGPKGGEPIVAKGKYQRWLEPDGLLLLEGWARDGLTVEQIAHNMGITAKTLYEWKNRYSEICEALKKEKKSLTTRLKTLCWHLHWMVTPQHRFFG